MNIWDTPYKDLPWKYRWFVQPAVMTLKGINWVIRKTIKSLR